MIRQDIKLLCECRGCPLSCENMAGDIRCLAENVRVARNRNAAGDAIVSPNDLRVRVTRTIMRLETQSSRQYASLRKPTS